MAGSSRYRTRSTSRLALAGAPSPRGRYQCATGNAQGTVLICRVLAVGAFCSLVGCLFHRLAHIEYTVELVFRDETHVLIMQKVTAARGVKLGQVKGLPLPIAGKHQAATVGRLAHVTPRC